MSGKARSVMVMSHRTCVLIREPVPRGVAYALHLATLPERGLSLPLSSARDDGTEVDRPLSPPSARNRRSSLPRHLSSCQIYLPYLQRLSPSSSTSGGYCFAGVSGAGKATSNRSGPRENAFGWSEVKLCSASISDIQCHFFSLSWSVVSGEVQVFRARCLRGFTTGHQTEWFSSAGYCICSSASGKRGHLIRYTAGRPSSRPVVRATVYNSNRTFSKPEFDEGYWPGRGCSSPLTFIQPPIRWFMRVS